MILFFIIAMINNAFTANLKTDNHIKSSVSNNLQIME
jgi:hypothetical protein